MLIERKRYEKGTGLVAAYSPRLKRIGIQNWRRASTVAGMSRQAFDAQCGVVRGIAGRPASSTQWNRIGKSRWCSLLSGGMSRDQARREAS
jgi:hypothetical protein